MTDARCEVMRCTLEGGKLVGLVSERDVQFIDSLVDVDPARATVREAMSPDVFAVSPRATVRRVAMTMAKHKYGSAIVVERNRVVGVFTTRNDDCRDCRK